ncbi:hypothetical protein HY387_01120 [Candidatus Daviesbacteria bacterium]|nr:hypothetical protein [Candidatus Daviesbacteria bacterium]
MPKIILLGLAVAAVVFFSKTLNLDFLKKQPNLTSPATSFTSQKSQLYTNKEVGMTLEIPTGFTIFEESEADYYQKSKANFRKNFTGYVGFAPPQVIKTFYLKGHTDNLASLYDSSHFSLWVFENADNLTIGEWYKNFWYYPFVWGEFTEPMKGSHGPNLEATIAGQLAKYNIISYQPGKPKFYYLATKNRMFLFRILDSQEKDIGFKVLSSFKMGE